MTIALILKAWTDRSGRERRYVNNLADIIGLDVERYNTGNIRHAELNGQVISNAAAQRILGGKVWFDESGEIHIDHWNELYAITAEQIRDKVTEAYARGLNCAPGSSRSPATDRGICARTERRETITLTADADTVDAEDGTTLTLTVTGNEVRRIFRDADGGILSDDTGYHGDHGEDKAEEWVRQAVIDYTADGWIERAD